MDMQQSFDRLLSLLKEESAASPLIDGVVHEMETNEVDFETAVADLPWDRAQQVYAARAAFDKLRGETPFVEGWDALLAGFEANRESALRIENVSCASCTYVVFSTSDNSKFVGVLKSLRTRDEVRERMADPRSFGHELARPMVRNTFIAGRFVSAN